MRISWNWLQRYMDIGLTPRQAADVLTSTGLETESVELVEPVKGMLKGVVVGHILDSERHPDADRLTVCLVDLGSEDPVRIVCGAPNVTKGQKVLVATVGSVLHMTDGTSITIKKSRIRGQESHGMICAEDELGLGTGHDGIMVLDPSAEVGISAAIHLELNTDHVLEIGLTPNRTDAMGHVGVARDLIAALDHRQGIGATLKMPDVSAFTQDDDRLVIPVEVLDQFACPRYAGLTFTNITIGPSPQWMQDLLKAIGVKPINNVVDITNFIQHELGHPLHAFDAEELAGGRIIVRKASAAEPFTTLDGKERRLDVNDLVIADAEKPACIAGVFGGARSGVSERTTSIFLESAVFTPSSIRSTARRHGLNTDASFRYERGADPDIVIYALKRAALLLKEYAGARISSPILDIQAAPTPKAEVRLRFSDIEKLGGVAIPPDDVVDILRSLDIEIKERDAEILKLIIPRYRVDVTRPVDVIEEILRIHGFDHVPIPEQLMCPPVLHEALDMESLRLRLGEHLSARGMREVMTASLVSSTKAIRSGSDESSLVKLRNPLSAELDVLRPTMLSGMLQTIAYNVNRQQYDLRLFERGRIYHLENSRTKEHEMLALAITGAHARENWRTKPRKAVQMDIKEAIETILVRTGLNAKASWKRTEHPHLRHAFDVFVNGHRLGRVGEVEPSIAKLHDVDRPVFFAEVDEQVLLRACRSNEITFEDIPRSPSVRRDLSLFLDDTITFDQLTKLAFNAERKLLKAVDLFDVYQGEKLPKGRKSYALSFIFQDVEKTLTDDQVERSIGRIREAFENETGATLRG